jgi:glycosyltransferase involved in cell wall biosynthesis
VRVTFVLSDANLTGGVRAVAIYAEKLKARGHHVVVVSRPRPPRFALRQQIKSLLTGDGWPSNPNMHHHHLVDTTVDHRVIDRWRPITDGDVPDADVVVATWWETAEWVAALSPTKGAKAYFLQHHEVVFNSQPGERVAATWRLPMHKIVCARWLKELAASEYGDTCVDHVPYGVDPKLFYAEPRGKHRPPTVGVMYSMSPWKGCDISFKAFEMASDRLRGLRLLTFAAIKPEDELPLPAGAQFFLQPPQDKIREIYTSCDAWLFASRCEGYGLPLLEAMACRTPIIATPTGAGPELCADGGGILIPHDDPPAMAGAIEQICTLPDPQWREMSDAAAATAKRYNWDESTRLFEAALEHAIERGRWSNSRPAYHQPTPSNEPQTKAG